MLNKTFYLSALTLIIQFLLVNCGEKLRIESNSILDEKIQDALSSLPENLISNHFKDNLKDDNFHWCCKINIPIISNQQTRIVSYNFVNSGNHRCGYQSCGFLGWSSCTKWCFSYWQETRYMIDTYTVTYQGECPQEHFICCPDYFLIMGHCFHINEIQNNLELLTALNNQGIVLPGIGK